MKTISAVSRARVCLFIAALWLAGCDSAELVRDSVYDPRGVHFVMGLPQQPQAFIESDREIKIVWQGVYTELSRLAISRRINHGAFVLVDTVEARDQTFQDTYLLDQGDIITYRLSPATGLPGGSVETPPLIYALSQPEDLAVEGTGETSLTLRWSAVSGPITGYRIEQRDYPGGAFSEIGRVGVDEALFMVQGLSVGRSYQFQVRSLNARHESSPAMTKSVRHVLGFQILNSFSLPRSNQNVPVSFIPNSSFFAVGGGDPAIRIGDYATGKWVRDINFSAWYLKNIISLDETGTMLAVDQHGLLISFQAHSGAILSRSNLPAPPTNISFSRERMALAASFRSPYEIGLFSVPHGEPVLNIQRPLKTWPSVNPVIGSPTRGAFRSF